MKKPLFFWAAFLVCDIFFLFTFIMTKLNFIFAGFICLVLGVLSSIAILKTGYMGFKFKLGMALGMPFKYFLLSIFSFLISFWGTSETPMYIFLGLYLASIIGAPIAIRFAVKSQKQGIMSSK